MIADPDQAESLLQRFQVVPQGFGRVIGVGRQRMVLQPVVEPDLERMPEKLSVSRERAAGQSQGGVGVRRTYGILLVLRLTTLDLVQPLAP